MSEELRPCPFCGSGEATIEPILIGAFDTPRYCVICSKCGADSEVDLGKSGAVECWNTRPLEDALRAALAEANDKLSEIVAYGGYYADIDHRVPPDGQVVKVVAVSPDGVDDFVVLHMDGKWYFATDPPREVPSGFEVIRIKPWDVKRFGATDDEEF